MKQDDVTIGQTYRAKVTNQVVPVRIDAEHPSGGWQATNLVTNKKVRIKSAQRLRGPATAADRAKTKQLAKKKLGAAELKSRHKADQDNARLRDEREASPDGMTASERAMAESANDGKAANPDAKPRKKRSGPSLIDAAITVLREAEGPMTCSQMIEAIFERKLWSSSGKTPAATLYSAILREIQNKGDASRFAHVDRGQFALTNAAAEEKGA